MSTSLLLLLSYLNLFSLLIPIGIGLFRWSYLSTSLRIAWAGLLSYFLLFSLSMLQPMGYFPFDSRYISYAMPLLFGAAFTGCYALAVTDKPSRRLILGLGLIGLTSLLIEATLKLNELTVSTIAIPIQTIINTIIPLIYLRYVTQTATTSLLAIPLFWITMGRLVSSLTSTLYDALRGPMIESSRELLINWLLCQLCITIVCNVVYGIGFWKIRRS